MLLKAISLLFLIFHSSLALGVTFLFDCTFPKAASQEGLKDQEFGFKILIDAEEGREARAYIIGGGGSSDLQLVAGVNNAFTFIETTGSGNVMTTTILQSGEAVHSRNISFMGKDLALATQNYGTCEMKQP